MYREIAGTYERVRTIPGVRDRRVRATKVRLYCLMSHDFRIEVVSMFNRICYYSKDKQHIIDKSVVNVNNSGECSSSKQSTSSTRF